MNDTPDRPDGPDRLDSIEALEAHYGLPVQGALDKELGHISDPYRRFIERSPFVILATCGPEGLDCSPRGDPQGFVRVIDKRRVQFPDRRGNNRIDSLRNIVRDPRVSLLFVIPGVGETLRINGQAELLVDHDLLHSFAMGDKVPKCVVSVTVDRIYYQCQKALHRSRLWDPEGFAQKGEVPTAGEMLKSVFGSDFDAESYDANYPEHRAKTIY